MSSQRLTSTIFLITFFQYFSGFLYFKDLPINELTWLILLIALVIFSGFKSIAVAAFIYFVFALFYTTGVTFDREGLANSVYYRTILTSFILSALVLSCLRLDLRYLPGRWRSISKFKFVHFVAIVLFAGWALTALQALNIGLLTDFRDVTGAGYLTLSDAFALLSLAYLCREKLPSWEFVLVFGISVVVIFLLGSRTTLAFYPFAVAFLLIRQVSFKGAIGWAAFLGGAAFYGLRDIVDTGSAAFFRFNSLFSLDNDQSAIVRAEIRELMLARMNYHPECFIISCHPENGWYDHSIFSVVQHFGLAGIVVLIGALILSIVRFRYLSQQWYFPIFVYCAVSLLLSRAWVSIVFPVFIAFLLDAALSASEKGRVLNRKILSDGNVRRMLSE